MLRYTGTTYGKVTIKQELGDIKQKFTVDIREANCLCAFIHVRKLTEEEKREAPGANFRHTLYSFFADERHIKNIMKDNGGRPFWDEVAGIKLNMYYKESGVLLKYFVRAGYKVECYYKEPKKK